jgi:mRNA interferase MazF
MAGFEPWDVVRVPFPYTDRPVRQWRPAVVVAGGRLAATHGLLWVLMVTSAENRRWPEDVVVSDPALAGLPAPSVVRTAKIATIDAEDAERIGALPRADRRKVVGHIAQILGPARTGAAMK